MASIKHFEDINAWQNGRLLSRQIYNLTQQKAFYKDYAIRDQIRRAAISVTSNIAEGFERSSNKEFIYFLSIAKGSAGEVRSLLYLALDYGYIDDPTFNRVQATARKTNHLLAGLIRYLSQSPLKGTRHIQKTISKPK